jgi:hypothetical protein
MISNTGRADGVNLERVVFIAGANWSGSTLTGAVLGANSGSPFEHFHIGEAHALFRPESLKFGDLSFAKKFTDFWSEVDVNVGPQGAYDAIAKHSKARILIDSSKAIVWLGVQRRVCEELGVPLLPLVTFRGFAGILQSAIRRKKGSKAGFKNLHYYQRLFASGLLGDNWISVDTEALVLEPAKMTQLLCRATGIPYFEGKEKYWNYPLLHLSGGATQRRHSKNPAEASYDTDQVKGEELKQRLADRLEKSGLRKVENLLRERSVLSLVEDKRV